MASWKRIITTSDDSAYKNSNLTASDIPNSAITTAKIADSAVATAKIADLGVTTAKIANDAITQGKIADNAIGGDQLASSSINHPSKFANDVVTAAAIGANAVGASELNVTGNGTSGYLLASDADGSFSWVAPVTGDITTVGAGTGLNGGGASGDVTINLNNTINNVTELVNNALLIGVSDQKPRIKFEFDGTPAEGKILFGIDDDTDTMEFISSGNDAANQDILKPTANRSVQLGTSSATWEDIHTRSIRTVFFHLNGTQVSSTGAELNTLDGFTGSVDDFNYAKDLRATGVTSTEFDYLDGVTSNIQTQFSGKAAIAGSTGQNFSTNDLNVNGNLTVSGTTTTINTATLSVEDKLITLGNVSTPTETTANGAGIQIEASGTEAEWPELKWDKDGQLTGWTLADYKATSNEDFPVSVMKFGTSAPSGAPDSGAGTLYSDTTNNNAYIYI